VIKYIERINARIHYWVINKEIVGVSAVALQMFGGQGFLHP